MKFKDIQKECKQTVKALVNQGKEVCDEFQCEPERNYFCRICGYSQYIHLAKQISELESE